MGQEKEIFIIRHGQTELNRQGIIQGRGVNAPLNELGRLQAKAFFEHYRHEPFDQLFSSTLLRAQQTISDFVAMGIPHASLPELDEISWGEMEGKLEVHEWDNTFREMTGKWSDGQLDVAAPGGETPNQLQKRQLKLVELLKNHPARKILISSHGRYIRALMCTLTGQSLSKMETFTHTNLCLYLLKYREGTFHLLKADERAHLSALTQSH